ncbi:NTP-PPase_u3 domain containing protein [uncultured Caudovirales phage]|uniref:NTP-PPase_u3 domain containing protein n=1 Tax=uncultured Caudovirales phage TaxID=2100421 RepID=A0A6J5MV79_9CAUD|nr:NTP-PPase_u3 domain containing protein [uncultured Caudovirales phage]
MRELIALTIAWAAQKEIITKGTVEKQSLKTLEEAGELVLAVGQNNREEIKDAIGDIMVTIIIQAEMQGLKLEDCLQSAYNVVSKRTGVMNNGTFIKN